MPPRSAPRLRGDSLIRQLPECRQPGAAVDSLPRRPWAGGPRRRAAGARGPLGRDVLLRSLDRVRRVIELRNGRSGLEGTLISNTGDYGHFAGAVEGDSFSLSHFDGSFVYLIDGVLHGDTLRGVFHAGLAPQTPFEAVRSTGATHLKAPTEVTERGHHDALPLLGTRSRRARWCPSRTRDSRARWWWWTSSGVGAPPVTRPRRCSSGSTGSITRAGSRSWASRTRSPATPRGRETGAASTGTNSASRFHSCWPGINDVEAAGATLPQLSGFTSFPTTVFLEETARYAWSTRDSTGRRPVHSTSG